MTNKDELREAFLMGYAARSNGNPEDDLSEIKQRTAAGIFNRWWDVNHE